MMKTLATHSEQIQVEIDPLRVLLDLKTQWKHSIGVPDDWHITDNGLWVVVDHLGSREHETSIRKAHIDEVETNTAFNVVIELTRKMQEQLK